MRPYGLADVNHAADDECRRSASCSLEFLGCHLLDQEVGRQTFVAVSSGESEFHALTLCAARLIFTKNLVEGFGFPLVEGPILGLLSGQRSCEWQNCWKAQASSSPKSLVATGWTGRTGGSRQGRHVAEHCRLGERSFWTRHDGSS